MADLRWFSDIPIYVFQYVTDTVSRPFYSVIQSAHHMRVYVKYWIEGYELRQYIRNIIPNTLIYHGHGNIQWHFKV